MCPGGTGGGPGAQGQPWGCRGGSSAPPAAPGPPLCHPGGLIPPSQNPPMVLVSQTKGGMAQSSPVTPHRITLRPPRQSCPLVSPQCPPSPRSCPLCVPPNPSRTPKAQPRPVTPRWVSLSPLPGPARLMIWLPVKPVKPSAAPAAPGVAGPGPAARPCPELDADPAAVPDAVCIPRQAGIFLIKPASLDAI